MPLFNPDKIASLVSEMRKAINHLKSLGNLVKELFLNDPDKIGSAKYNFVIAIESVIILYPRMVIEPLRITPIPFRFWGSKVFLINIFYEL